MMSFWIFLGSGQFWVLEWENSSAWEMGGKDFGIVQAWRRGQSEKLPQHDGREKQQEGEGGAHCLDLQSLQADASAFTGPGFSLHGNAPMLNRRFYPTTKGKKFEKAVLLTRKLPINPGRLPNLAYQSQAR